MSESVSLNVVRCIYIDYTNYRGERSVRRVIPLTHESLRFESNEYHTAQWLLHALDVEKGAMRTFAMKDIHQWSTEPIAGSGQR